RGLSTAETRSTARSRPVRTRARPTTSSRPPGARRSRACRSAGSSSRWCRTATIVTASYASGAARPGSGARTSPGPRTSSNLASRTVTCGSPACRAVAAATMPGSASTPCTSAARPRSAPTSAPAPHPTSSTTRAPRGTRRTTQRWKWALWSHGCRALTAASHAAAPRTRRCDDVRGSRVTVGPSLDAEQHLDGAGEERVDGALRVAVAATRAAERRRADLRRGDRHLPVEVGDETVAQVVDVVDVVRGLAALGERELLAVRAAEPAVERARPLGERVHPRLLPVRGHVLGALARDERALETVERGVDLVRVVPAADQVEDRRLDVGAGQTVRHATLVHVARVLEELVDLLGVVPVPGPRDRGEQRTHSSSSAASCPQAPSMSLPRVSRIVVGIPCPRNRATNSASTAGSLAVQIEPGVGLSGIGLTCTQPRPRALSFSPSRSARHAWSFMSLMSAYSMLTRRPVTSK